MLTLSWGSKRIDTKVSILLGLQFPSFLSLAQTGDRRPLRKLGTTEEFFFRRGAQCAPISLHLRSARYRTATHAVYSPQARHTRAAQLFARCDRQFLRVALSNKLYRRVRRPRRTVVNHLHIASPQGRPVAAHATPKHHVHSANGTCARRAQFSILHFQFFTLTNHFCVIYHFHAIIEPQR